MKNEPPATTMIFHDDFIFFTCFPTRHFFPKEINSRRVKGKTSSKKISIVRKENRKKDTALALTNDN